MILRNHYVLCLLGPNLPYSYFKNIILVTKKLVTLHESDPELAEQIVRQLYHAAMANAGLNDDAVSIANKTNNLVEMFLEKL